MLTGNQQELIEKLSKIDNFADHLRSLLSETESRLKQTKDVQEAIDKLLKEKTQGFPWLADAISQYYEFRDLKIAEFLDHKLRPAVSSADRVRELAAEKREFQRKFIVTRNLIKYYETLFPWLSEFVGEDIDELLIQSIQQGEISQEQDDPVRTYLTQGEYEKLSPAERNQRALDRYWTKRKTSWEVGRDYERYIGYLYEQKGFSVHYQGIERGLEDLGRDLICKKGNEVEIVQCKYWREGKTIHEKHINQLFGTTVEYFIKHIYTKDKVQLHLFPDLLRTSQLTAALVTSATVSDTATDFASVLGVKIDQKFPFKKYPTIKCNVSRRDGTKIYHLPFDQQYDRTLVEEERNECYVQTTSEAERLGFRRAWRWRGNTE